MDSVDWTAIAKTGLTVKDKSADEVYLDLLNQVKLTGTKKDDRTKDGTVSLFGVQRKYSLERGRIPLISLRDIYWKGIVEELLWFISGSTDSEALHKKGVKIWNWNGSQEYFKKIGRENQETGDLGPIYGFQWRHFGAKYIDKHTDYSEQGVDQLQNCIDTLLLEPDSRRIVMSAWNPVDLMDMVLPPCHVLVQFNTRLNQDHTNRYVDCLFYQRSADLGLGVPFNIASYGLLTHMICHVTGYLPGTLTHSIGDCHIYNSHLKEIPDRFNTERMTKSDPTVVFKKEVCNIDDFTFDDIVLCDYYPQPRIRLELTG